VGFYTGVSVAAGFEAQGARKDGFYIFLYDNATRLVEVLDHDQRGGIMIRVMRQWLPVILMHIYYQFLFSDENP
jgi:hypothetical protein